MAVIVRCANCGASNWVVRPEERRNKRIPEKLDLECGDCQTMYCAANRIWSSEDETEENITENCII